jgi:LPXTG-motif cell wall-anchored protein
MKKKILAFIMVMLLCIGVAPSAFASSVTYEGQAEKFVFAPGSSYSPTDLFENFKDVMPGDELTQQIQVKNAAENNVKVKIYMRALGAQKDSAELLSLMNLTVKQDGKSVLFDAPADQKGTLEDWVCLGTFYSGADVTLDVTLSVSPEMGNDFQETAGYLDWQFKVEEFPIEASDPKTGDDFNVWLYIGIGAVALCGIVLLVKHRKEDN